MKPTVCLPLLAALPFVLAAGAEETLAPLPLELPIPAIKYGFVHDLDDPHIEAYSDELRPPFLAPVGVVNLARGRPVTSSYPDPVSGQLKQIADGDKEGARERVVELGQGTQWVQIDLGAPARLAAVMIWHTHHVLTVCHDVILLVSNDPEFKVGVTMVFNNDYDDTSGLGPGRDKEYYDTWQGRLIDAKGAKARYVRVYGRGSTFTRLNWYTEIEVWGLVE